METGKVIKDQFINLYIELSLLNKLKTLNKVKDMIRIVGLNSTDKIIICYKNRIQKP